MTQGCKIGAVRFKGQDNVHHFNGISRLPLPPANVLAWAMEANLKSAVIVGWTSDGDLYFASSEPDGGECLWIMELAKKRLLEMGDA